MDRRKDAQMNFWPMLNLYVQFQSVRMYVFMYVYLKLNHARLCIFLYIFSTLGVACLAHLEMHGQKHTETQTEKNAFSSSQWQEDENTDKDAHHTVDAVIVTNATP